MPDPNVSRAVCRLCGCKSRYIGRGLTRLHFVAQHPWIPFVFRERWLTFWRLLFIREES